MKRFFAWAIPGIYLFCTVSISSAGMECDGTLYNGVMYKRGQHYYPTKNGVKYDCVACGGCTSTGGSGSFGNGGYGSSGNWKRDMAVSLFQSMMSGFLRGMQGGGGQSRSPVDDAAEARRKQAAAAWEKQMKAQISDMERQYADRRRQEMEEVKGRLLGGLREPGSTGHSGRTVKALECSAYWSRKAAAAALVGNPLTMEDAIASSRKAELAMSGGDVDCPDTVENAHIPEPKGMYREEFRREFHETMVTQMNEAVRTLGDIRQRKTETEKKIVRLQEDIDRAQKDRSDTVREEGTPPQDDLLAQSLAALGEAKKEMQQAEAKEKEVMNTIEAIKRIDDAMKKSEDNRTSGGEK